jgi:hypothetical protein
MSELYSIISKLYINFKKIMILSFKILINQSKMKSKTNKKFKNGYVNMVLRVNALIVLILNLFLMLNIFHLSNI